MNALAWGFVAIGAVSTLLFVVQVAVLYRKRNRVMRSIDNLSVGPRDNGTICKSPLSAAILKQTADWKEARKNQPIGPACLPADFEPTEEMLKLNPYLPRKAKMPVLEDVPEVNVDMFCDRVRQVLESAIGREFKEPQVIRMMMVPGDDAMRAALAHGKLTILVEAGTKQDVASMKQCASEAVDQAANSGNLATFNRF